MAKYKVVVYRDNDGYIISSKKPIWTNSKKASGGYKIASLIWCPERECLRWIGHCENCGLFDGHEQYRGVRCKSTKPLNAGKINPDKYR